MLSAPDQVLDFFMAVASTILYSTQLHLICLFLCSFYDIYRKRN